MTAKAAAWLGVYASMAAFLAWWWLRNPASPQGLPADPGQRLGIASVVLAPAGLLLAWGLSRLHDDETGARLAVLGAYAVLTVVVVLYLGFVPDELDRCGALRGRVPVLPEPCRTTPQLRAAVMAEATVDWLLLAVAWAGLSWRRRGGGRASAA